MLPKSKKIIFTGGGSAGHVAPNIALIKKFLQNDWKVFYIGSKTGIEKELISKIKIPYYEIASGKLRRYFSCQNFIDPFKIVYGVFQAFFFCSKIKPDIVFSKGGFVSLPVVIAARILRIPVVIHESDITIGLTNRVCFPLAAKICVTFSETINGIKDKQKVVVAGIPIRKEFFVGDSDLGRKICGFTKDKKIITVFGGSLGAEKINVIIRKLLPKILEKFQVIHICGKGKIDESLEAPGYKQFAYLHEDFPHILAASDMVVSRAGANSIYELIILRKPNILLPLGKSSSRGDQILNAKYAAQKGFSEVVFAEELTEDYLLEKIDLVANNAKSMVQAMAEFKVLPAQSIIYDLIAKIVG